jgi:signal transduction histidine kinase
MRIGIRTKLVILLVAVALLPLLAALLTIVVGGRQLRSEVFGRGILAAVSPAATNVEDQLLREIEVLQVGLHQKPVVAMLAAADTRMSDEELAEIGLAWPNLEVDDPRLRKILDNDIADALAVIQREEEQVAEILVTDRFGQLLAATGRTEDFDQSDEDWWQRSYNDGMGQICVREVTFDKSARTWGVTICVPVLQDGKVIGVAKLFLSLNHWLPEATRDVGGGEAQLSVVNDAGAVIYSPEVVAGDAEPLERVYPGWAALGLASDRQGWRVTPDERIVGFAPVLLPAEMDDLPVAQPTWTLVLSMREMEARRGLTRLTMTVLLVGLLLISGLFLGGVVLIDRSVINRIRRISRSARQVAEGELKARADATWTGTRVFGTDEIDDLARDFNNMVRKLQRSNAELTEANELKENFIRIAGHELRTPVSYIVGMSKLLKDCQDRDRLAQAMDTIGFKAGRLDEIIQSMFKLIPEQALDENLEYGPVDLTKLLESVYTDCQPWIERRNQTLIIETGDEEAIIQADESKLRDIIENLVMNAIKFTPDGGEVRIAVQKQLGGYVAIEVFDQGPGIPEQDRPHIFEPFYSGSDIMTHSTGKSGYGKKGMGLGLAIVKHFTELHGGIIQFITGPNGTTFIVQLPIDPPPTSRHPGMSYQPDM